MQCEATKVVIRKGPTTRADSTDACRECARSIEANARFCGHCGECRLARGSDHLEPILAGRYTIDHKIGEGGFSVVYRGTQIATGRKVALKFPAANRRGAGDTNARFRREALLSCNLRDPHTVTTYDYGHTANGTPFIVMELLEGLPLREVLRREGPLQWTRVCKVLREICSSLAEAHANGIVHRDLKPENVFLERRGIGEFVKLLDFGIAKLMFSVADDPDMELTAFGETLGTAFYMSPEQRFGAALDGRSDIFSLGVLVYELLTSRVPCAPEAPMRGALLPPSRNGAICIPPRLDQIVMRCLEVDKQRRFADVVELVAAIDQMAVTSTSFAQDLEEPLRTEPDLQTIRFEGDR